jgi:hypothetical protein
MTPTAVCFNSTQCSGRGYCFDQKCACRPLFEGCVWFFVDQNCFVFNFTHLKLKSTGDYCEVNQVDTIPGLYTFFWVYCYSYAVLFFGIAIISIVQFGLLVRFRGWKHVTKV